MKRWLCGVGLVVVAISMGAACGDSDDGTTGTAGTGGTGGSGGAGGSGATDGGDDEGGTTTSGCTVVRNSDKIDYTGAAAPTYTCDANKSTAHPNGPNACRNASDCAIINTGRVRALVRDCGLGCREGTCEQMAACNSTCVTMNTATMIMQPGLSAACGACYTEIALCSLAFCLAECAPDPDAIVCAKCQFANGCRVPFERCSGVDRQP
jgi:hypothetical protein